MPWLQPELLQWHNQIINLCHHSRNSWNLNFYQGLAWLHFFLFFLSLPWMKSASSEASSLSAASPMSNTLVQLQLLWREWDTTPSKCLRMTWGTLAAVWADQLVSGWAWVICSIMSVTEHQGHSLHPWHLCSISLHLSCPSWWGGGLITVRTENISCVNLLGPSCKPGVLSSSFPVQEPLSFPSGDPQMPSEPTVFVSQLAYSLKSSPLLF